MKKFLLLALALLYFPSIQAEIISATIYWRAANCTYSCPQRLAQRLQANVPGIGAINFNAAGGQASLSWKPNYPFDLVGIKNAMSWVGMSVQTMQVHLELRGLIQTTNGKQFTIISLGDNTPVLLLGPMEGRPGQALVTYSYNPINYPFDQYKQQQLIQAAQSRIPITVSGSLIAIYRSPPMMMIVQNMKLDAPRY